MNIPEKVKVGGKTYTVNITDRLALGTAHFTAEVLYTDLEINITQQAKEKMEADFLHELIHAIHDHQGQQGRVEEREVDAMAQSLYMVIQDNPGIFSEAVKITEDTEPCEEYTDHDVWKALVAIRKKYPAFFERHEVVVNTPPRTMCPPFMGMADIESVDLRMVEVE